MHRSWHEGSESSAQPRRCRIHGLREEDRDRHRPDSAGDRRYQRRPLRGLGEGDVSDVAGAIPGINDDSARFDPLAFDELRAFLRQQPRHQPRQLDRVDRRLINFRKRRLHLAGRRQRKGWIVA